MASPLTADRLLAALRAEGCRVVEHPNWRTHNRNHRGPFGPMNGVTIHHTAGVGSGIVETCYEGTGDLPGPLCHSVLTKAAAVHMVGNGRANHAGTFAANAHAAVLNESSTHPRPDAAEPVDGNAHYYGLEIENKGDGRDPYPPDQYDQAVRWAAAICRTHGWSADSVIGHKEGTRRKIDPSFSMDRFRADVAARLTHPPGWSPGTPQEEDMPLTAADIDRLAVAVLKRDGIISIPGASADNPTWTLSSAVTEVLKRLDKANASVAALTAANTKLVDTVAQLAGRMGDLDPAAIVAELSQAIESISIRLDVPDQAQ